MLAFLRRPVLLRRSLYRSFADAATTDAAAPEVEQARGAALPRTAPRRVYYKWTRLPDCTSGARSPHATMTEHGLTLFPTLESFQDDRWTTREWARRDHTAVTAICSPNPKQIFFFGQEAGYFYKDSISDTFICDIDTGETKYLFQTDESLERHDFQVPYKSYAVAPTAIDDKIFVFGRTAVDEANKHNVTVQVLDLATREGFTQLPPRKEAPKRHQNMFCTIDPKTGMIYLLHRADKQRQRVLNVTQYDPETNEFKLLVASNNDSVPLRKQARAFVIDDHENRPKLVVEGGFSIFTGLLMDRLDVLDLQTLTWQKAVLTGDVEPLPPRKHAAFARVSDNAAMLVGGRVFGGGYFSDAYALTFCAPPEGVDPDEEDGPQKFKVTESMFARPRFMSWSEFRDRWMPAKKVHDDVPSKKKKKKKKKKKAKTSDDDVETKPDDNVDAVAEETKEEKK